MEDESADVIEQTLYQLRAVKAYRIPPRPAAGGHRSGEWRVDDQIFSGRLRVVARGEAVQLRLEDGATGELFAMCPFTPATQQLAVEAAADSSRNFVLRVEDPATHRHAFLGLGFAERGESFDFQAALADHARHCERERLSNQAAGTAAAGAQQQLAAGSARPAPPGGSGPSLFKDPGDLRLKDGQMLHIEVKHTKPGGSGSGLLSRASAGGLLFSSDGSSSKVLLPPPPAPKQPQQQQQQPVAAVVADSQADWAKFD